MEKRMACLRAQSGSALGVTRLAYIGCIVAATSLGLGKSAYGKEGVDAGTVLEIVSEGRPKASIVVPDQALPVVTYTVQELQYHIERANHAVWVNFVSNPVKTINYPNCSDFASYDSYPFPLGSLSAINSGNALMKHKGNASDGCR